jgi:hypothetical protein
MITCSVKIRFSQILLCLYIGVLAGCSFSSNKPTHKTLVLGDSINFSNQKFMLWDSFSCEEVIVSDNLYYLGYKFRSDESVTILDSFFFGYLINADSSLLFDHPAAPPEGIISIKRIYWLPGQDSSYFIFHAFSGKNIRPNNYRLYEARIVSSKFQYLNGIQIGITKNDFKSMVHSSGEITFHHTPETHSSFQCDTITTRCDGLCGRNFYIFVKDSLKKILFYDHHI